MAIIQAPSLVKSKGLKYSGLLFITMLFLAGCSSSSLISTEPQHSISISSSPALSLSPCMMLKQPVEFINAHIFRYENKLYTLIGVLPISHPSQGIPKEYLTQISAETICIKNDPSINDAHHVYALNKEERMINSLLIQNGYAQTDEKTDYLYRGFFKKLEQEAKQQGRGLWKSINTSSNTSPTSPSFASSKSITPDTISTALNIPITLTFSIASVGFSDKGVYLNSLNDFAQSSNIAVLIPQQGDERMTTLRKNAETYIGHPISVHGTVRLIGGKMILLLEKGSDLTILR